MLESPASYASYESYESSSSSASRPSSENAPRLAPSPWFTSHFPLALIFGYRLSGGTPYSLVWIHAYADAMFPVAHPRSKSSQSMSAYGLRRPRVPSATNRAASTTAAVLYAQHPAHAPWCTTSPKSTWSLQSKESGRPEPSGPDASRADDEEN